MTQPRRAFTLLEVMVALTVTALALTSAGVAVGAARSTAARVARHTQHTEADGRVRTLLTDMLRHAPLAEQIDGALLEVDGSGRAPVLRFVSTGVRAPFGTGPLWQVEVSLADSVLTVRATPLTRGATDQPLVATLSPVELFAVRALTHSSGTDAAAWRTDWPLAQDRPRAVELQWRHVGAPVAAPLRVVLSPLEAPR